MLHDLLEREESLKATALRAANAGDWTTVVANARALVSVYRAILASGLVPASEEARWTALRDRWTKIGDEAALKAPASRSAAPAPGIPGRLSFETPPPAAPAPAAPAAPAPASSAPAPAAPAAALKVD